MLDAGATRLCGFGPQSEKGPGVPPFEASLGGLPISRRCPRYMRYLTVLVTVVLMNEQEERVKATHPVLAKSGTLP